MVDQPDPVFCILLAGITDSVDNPFGFEGMFGAIFFFFVVVLVLLLVLLGVLLGVFCLVFETKLVPARVRNRMFLTTSL
jgi:hypothetical protein